MPHIILRGPVSVEDVFLAFEPQSFTEKGNRFKAEDAFISRDKTALLIRSITIERGFTKTFYVRIGQREDGIHVGLDLLNPPEKSEGVKRLLGLYAWRIMQTNPEISVGATNLTDYLNEPAE
ncbi:hypothetical protein BH09SUM1_BH09SUM1_05240 [soil metagenome]